MIRRYIAPVRFGYGLRPDETPPKEPEDWLLGQLVPRSTPLAYTPLSVLHAASRASARLMEGRPAPTPDPMLLGLAANFGAMLATEERAWAQQRLSSSAPFLDRLVDFWTNHLSVSRRVPGIAPSIPPYEHEAIRPHVLGRFEDMLIAAIRHPAMLHYLGNHISMGPQSVAGRHFGRGLNENLAREVLELHTVSPAAGYGQADVEALAALLSGWGMETAPATGFRFQPSRHQPGSKSLLGRSFPDGEAGGLAALRFLANHPATFQHLASKLVRHFVDDQPAPGDVARVAAALSETSGDLAAAVRAVIALPSAWIPLRRFRSPRDYMLAVGRALGGVSALAIPVLRGMRETGQPIWAAPAADGWPDTTAAWLGPDTLLRRIELAHAMARTFPVADPVGLAHHIMGPLIRTETATAIHRAPSRVEAMALLFGSPEWMRQ